MAEYWLKRDANARIEGPYSAGQLRQLVSMGIVSGHSFISNNEVDWHDAPSVKGLFATHVPPAAPPVPGVAHHEQSVAAAEPGATGPGTNPYGIAEERDTSMQVPRPEWGVSAATAPSYGQVSGYPYASGVSPVHAQQYPSGMGWYSNGDSGGEVGPVRRLTWYFVLACVLLGYGVLIMGVSGYEKLTDNRPPPRSFEEWLNAEEELKLSDFLGCFGLLGLLGLWICWLVWVYQAHVEVRRYAGAAQPIGPGLALGLCFVPLFNLFWAPYIHYRLAETVQRCLGARAGECSPAFAVTFRILAIVPGGCCLLGLGPLFTALSMRHIQNAMNILWSQQSHVHGEWHQAGATHNWGR